MGILIIGVVFLNKTKSPVHTGRGKIMHRGTTRLKAKKPTLLRQVTLP